MWSNQQKAVDLVTFAEDILNVKLHFFENKCFLFRDEPFLLALVKNRDLYDLL